MGHYPLAFGALALIGFAASAIGIYRILYRTMTSMADVCLLFVGLVLLLGNIANVIGYFAVYHI